MHIPNDMHFSLSDYIQLTPVYTLTQVFPISFLPFRLPLNIFQCLQYSTSSLVFVTLQVVGTFAPFTFLTLRSQLGDDVLREAIFDTLFIISLICYSPGRLYS